jgi:hypothetical protein
MNRIIASTLIAASAAFAAPAFADDPTPTPPFVSTADRAQVLAELEQSRGGPNPWSRSYNPLDHFQSARTRAEVRAEFLGAREEVRAFTGEDSGSFALSQRRQADRTQVAGAADRGVSAQ